MHAYIHKYTPPSMRLYTYTNACINTYISTYLHITMCTFTPPSMRSQTLPCLNYMYQALCMPLPYAERDSVCMYTCTYMYVYIYRHCHA